jgi:hypothetical protein
MVMGYIHDGQLFSWSMRYASCTYPAFVSACVIIGVPAKPVETWNWARRTRRASLAPALAIVVAEGRRSKTSARLTAVCVSPTR